MKSAVLLKNYSLDKARDIKKAQPHLAWHNKIGFARILALSNRTGLPLCCKSCFLKFHFPLWNLLSLVKTGSQHRTRDTRKDQPHVAWHNKNCFARFLTPSAQDGGSICLWIWWMGDPPPPTHCTLTKKDPWKWGRLSFAPSHDLHSGSNHTSSSLANFKWTAITNQGGLQVRCKSTHNKATYKSDAQANIKINCGKKRMLSMGHSASVV